MEGETAGSRRKRKEEAKLLKRQRIEQSGGVRPRKADGAATVSLSSPPTNERQEADTATTLPGKQRPSTGSDRQGDNRRNGRTNTVGNMFNGRSSQTAPSTSSSSSSSSHRFGRVMDSVPCRNQPRLSTVSIAIPGSVVANCQTRELKTQISGQIARSATIYHVDEIIVFDDKLSKSESSHRRTFVPNRNSDGERRRPNGNGMTAASDNSVVPTTNHDGGDNDDSAATAAQRPRASTDPHAFLARILQYCECPQYLRRHFFPMHPDLQFAGLLAPIDAPHHVRADDRSPFREGVVLDKTHAQKGSLVNCGVYKRPVQYVCMGV